MAERARGARPARFFVNQFANPANPLAHETTHRAGNLGADGARGRCRRGGRRLRRHDDRASAASSPRVVAEDGDGARRSGRARSSRRWCGPARRSKPGSWTVEGIGEDFMPPNCDLSLVKSAYAISDKRKRRDRARAAAKEGILGGSSSGTLLAAALRYCREQTQPQARRHARLRQRQQISLQDVQRLLGGRAGAGRPQAARRSARPDRARASMPAAR